MWLLRAVYDAFVVYYKTYRAYRFRKAVRELRWLRDSFRDMYEPMNKTLREVGAE